MSRPSTAWAANSFSSFVGADRSLGGSWPTRQCRRASHGGHRQSTDLPAPDLRDRIGRGRELHMHLTADNIGQSEGGATVGYVYQCLYGFGLGRPSINVCHGKTVCVPHQKQMTMDEARRVASNIAKLPDMLKRGVARADEVIE